MLRRLPDNFGTVSRLTYIIVAAWLLTMISLPIFKWTIGTSAIVWGVNITTILQTAAVIAILHNTWGTKRTAFSVLIVMGLTWGIEAIGTATGFPFGHYNYTDQLQPQFANVPVLIAAAWLMMLPSAWAVGFVLSGKTRGIQFITISALAMTAWDLFLDPQMVMWGLWQWDFVGVGYFGIPWVNFLGWAATAAVVTAIVRPSDDLPVMPLFIIYSIVWLLQTIGQGIFWGQPGPAAIGFIGMGIFVVLTARRLWSQYV